MEGAPRQIHEDEPWGLQIEIGLLPRAVVCRVCGEVDGDTAQAVAKAFSEALARARSVDELQVDLSRVTLLTAAGITLLIRLRESANAAAVPLVLVAPNVQVLRVLDLTCTRKLFTVRTAARSNVAGLIDQAVRRAGDGLAAATWHPCSRDRAAAAALVPELRWAVAPPPLPLLVPLQVRADRMDAVVGELAVAALTTDGELSGLFSRCVAALAPPPPDEYADIQSIAEDPGSPAELSDIEAALGRLFAFVEPLAELPSV